MFVYAHVDEDTGEIVHCFVDNGDDIDFEANIANGQPPVDWPDKPPNIKPLIIKPEDIADKLADPAITRCTNDRSVIMAELNEMRNPTFDALRIREEFRFAKKGKELELQARIVRGKLDNKGHIVEAAR